MVTAIQLFDLYITKNILILAMDLQKIILKKERKKKKDWNVEHNYRTDH